MKDLFLKLLEDEHGDIKVVLAGAGFYALLPVIVALVENLVSLFMQGGIL